MESDDPEKRIRELERGLSDPTRVAPAVAPAWGYEPRFTPPPARVPWRQPIRILVGLSVLLPIVVAIIQVVTHLNIGNWISGNGGLITVAHGGTLSFSGNGQHKTIACNDGRLTVTAINSAVNVTGHCASLTMSGFDTQVNVEKADAVEVSGYGNTVTDTTCNDAQLTLSGYNNALSVGGHCAGLTVSSYGNRVRADSIDNIGVDNYGNSFSITGHCGSLRVSAYNNQVQVDSVDTVDVSGYSNTVTYHSGSPKITQSGSDITVKQG